MFVVVMLGFGLMLVTALSYTIYSGWQAELDVRVIKEISAWPQCPTQLDRKFFTPEELEITLRVLKDKAPSASNANRRTTLKWYENMLRRKAGCLDIPWEPIDDAAS